VSAIDEFATSLLEEAKRFREKAADADDDGRAAYLHAALMVGFCALEAFINAIADDFIQGGQLAVHEKAFLLEREPRLDNGEFKVSDTLKMSRLEDRIGFLHRRFSGRALDRTASWWSELSTALKLRNALTHPKDMTPISADAVERALQAIVDSIDAIFQAVYKAKFPAAGRGLQSKMNF
jgi:hypothetical protein